MPGVDSRYVAIDGPVHTSGFARCCCARPLFLSTTPRASIYILDPTAFEYHFSELLLSILLEVSETKRFTTTMDSIIRSLGSSGT